MVVVVAAFSLLLTACSKHRDIFVSNPCDDDVAVLLTSAWDSYESRNRAIEDAYEGPRMEVVVPARGVVEAGYIGGTSHATGTVWIDRVNVRVDFIGADIDPDTDTVVLPTEVCDLPLTPVDDSTVTTFWLGDPVDRHAYRWSPPTTGG